MRSFLKPDGWKSAILKIKIRKKVRGVMLLTSCLAVLVWIFIAQAFL